MARFYPRAGFHFTEKEGSEDTQSEEGSRLRMLRLKAKLLHLEEKTAVRGKQSASAAALRNSVKEAPEESLNLASKSRKKTDVKVLGSNRMVVMPEE